MSKTPTTPDEVFVEDVEGEKHLNALLDGDGEIIDIVLGEETQRKSIFDDDDDIVMEGDEYYD